jgi:hypothetical protein
VNGKRFVINCVCVLGVYGYGFIEPFRAAVHQGDWKLVWQITIPSKTELFNLAQDPAEETNLADRNRRMVTRLNQQVETASLESES